tara:strand:+ start:3240 stop:5588 length:2349 start_codon:yes stop_codon:yes gene_type:complete
MSKRATSATILTAMLLLTVPYAVLATDSDGDGTDDANDDFPNNPCADTDTDGDGLPDTVVSGCTFQSIVAYTSFEDPFTNGAKYFDTGNGTSNYYLWNNANEPHVAHNQTNGSEIGFTTFYTSNGGVGLTDGDYFGTANYTGTVGNYTEGTQGYQMGDVDGTATLALDDVTADSMTFDVFVQGGSSNSYEDSDNLIIRFVGSSSTVELLNVTGATGSSNHGGFAPYMGVWTSFSLDISSLGQGSLEIELTSNSQSESIYVDNVVFTSSVAMMADDDDDNDGWLDDDEVDCGTDPLDANDVPSDADGNGICDALEGDDYDGDGLSNENDPDDDNDGWDDTDEVSCNTNPLNGDSTPTDTDGDGVCDYLDSDDDNDGVEDGSDCDPLDPNETTDNDMDGICDGADDDDDNDGVADSDDAFPNDSTEWADADGDGKGDNVDDDDDNDGVSDLMEERCFSDPLDANSLPTDTDGDGECDPIDYDDDGDGYTDQVEGWCGSDPLDVNSIPVDSDGDGECDTMDNDSDNDGVNDDDDAFPDDNSEWLDTDGDGIGDNSDADDDDDGWSDDDEDNCGSDGMDSGSVPVDSDSDGICDGMDSDDDGDGVDDVDDAFPDNPAEWDDTDGDGIGDNYDDDDDGDGWSDSTEGDCGSDPMDDGSVPMDNDGDGNCDSLDPDDDGDGVADGDDAFPFDGLEWDDTDGDGIGNNADEDDDGDQFTDSFEEDCASNPLDSTSVPGDLDGDDICDEMDPDDTDGPNYVDPNGDNGTPGFGLISALAVLALAAFARRD